MRAAMRRSPGLHLPCQRASTGHAEEADEGTDRDDDALGTLDPVRARPVEDEGTESFGGIDACVITESVEETQKNPLIDVKSRLGQSTVSQHPRTKFSQDRPLLSY